MESQRYLASLWQSTWDSSQLYLEQGSSFSRPFTSASLSVLQIEDAKTVFANTLVFPGYAATASLLVLLLQLIAHSEPVKKLYKRLATSENDSADEIEDENVDDAVGEQQHLSVVSQHMAQYGGPVIFAYRVLRLLCTLALLALSILTAVFTSRQVSSPLNSKVLPHVALCLTYGYSSLLGILSVAVNARSAKLATHHLALVLAFTWIVFVYRDVWPLATYTLQPIDGAEGALLWGKFALLTVAGVVVPLLVPRQYTPADPRMPGSRSRANGVAALDDAFLWLDPTVFEAYKVPHLPSRSSRRSPTTTARSISSSAASSGSTRSK
ncbi:uncharacterized protein B0H18DRAFT_1188953 [Fomitopsis serialis]|uniref:uncharacterized protein n=1 Tax=Fomitopsis serialis TaxID=139415 RepID=UPI002008A2BF|nr:uncharacterized protein B0H18DRAFT_1188953 [Neoantrodia serialis]KAH9921469.1 hypothetical protein B0H18DRAFT_1188953 [Neoantrodia serialis]